MALIKYGRKNLKRSQVFRNNKHYCSNPVPRKPNIQHYLSRGIIHLDDVVGSDEETIMATIIEKIHKYSIKQLPDGRYMTYVPDETKPNGRRQIRKKSQTDLYRYLLAFYDISEEADKKGNMPFEELYKEWTEYKAKFIKVNNRKKGLSPTTIRRYERDYDKYFSGTDLAKQPISDISPIFLENALSDIIIDHSIPERSAGNLIGYVRQAFQYALRSRYLSKDPAALLDRQMLLAACTYVPPKADNERVLTLEELVKLKEALWEHERRHPSYMPDYAVELATLTGMRVGELAALMWECIDDKYIHIDYSEHRYDYRDKPSELVISEPKNGKHRLIPITDEIRELLGRIKKNQPETESGDMSEFLFVRSNGKRYTAHDIGCALDRRAAEAGIPKTSIHGIRRTVSSMLRTVLPVRAVANMLGHLEQTNDLCYNYDTTAEDEKRRALSEVSSKMAEKSSKVIIIRSDLAV